MEDLIDELEQLDEPEITEVYDLLPRLLAQAEVQGILTAREMEELLAVSATVNWAKLKLCHYRGLWMIMGCANVSEILTGSHQKHDIKHTSLNQRVMFY